MEEIKKKESTKNKLWFWTAFYLILFPTVWEYCSEFFMQIFNAPNDDFSIILKTPFYLFLGALPCSIPISIFLMWRRYFQHDLSNALFYCAVPLGIFAIGILSFLTF